VIFAHLIQSASRLPIDTSALESAISALERDIRAWDSSSGPWERSLPWFTALVALGVAMEFWVIWRERRDDVEAFSLGIVRLADRPSTVKYVIEILSVLFITAGIVGELWVGIKITSINGMLRSKNTELRSKTGQLIALLNQETEQLRKDANAEATKIEQLRKANNEAAANLEEEKRKRFELAASLLPRVFRDQSGAIAQLSTLPRVSVAFEFLDEREIKATAEQINFVTTNLYWNGWRRRGHEIFVDEGVAVSPGAKRPTPLTGPAPTIEWLTQLQRTEAVCDEVVRALQTSGIEAKIGNSGGGLPPGTIVISVGPKPNAVLEDTIKELAEPPPTPLQQGRFSHSMRGNRQSIPEAPPENKP
jgi:hypothetical protein